MKKWETNIPFTSSPGEVIRIKAIAKATVTKASLSSTPERARMSHRVRAEPGRRQEPYGCQVCYVAMGNILVWC